MARKAKTVEQVVAGQASAEPAPKTAITGDMDDLMASTAVRTEAPKKAAKKETFDVANNNSTVKAKLHSLLKACARRKAAESREEALKAELRPIFDKMYFAACREQKSFLRTICVNEAVNYGCGNVGIVGISGADDNALKASFAQVKATLTSLFGEKYNEYVKSTSVLQVKMTPENISILKSKLTPEEFTQIITYIPGLDVQTQKIGSDTIVPLKRDMSIDPTIDAKVRQGVGLKVLSLSNGAVTPQKSALAVVEEEELKELKDKENATAGQMAGAVAGAVTGAVVEAAVNAAVK